MKNLLELYEKQWKQSEEETLLLNSKIDRLQHEYQGNFLKKDQGMAVFKSNLSNTEKL